MNTTVRKILIGKGKIQSGSLEFDGKKYDYRSIWECDEDADEFVEAVQEAGFDIIAARDIEKGRLTLWFSFEERTVVL